MAESRTVGAFRKHGALAAALFLGILLRWIYLRQFGDSPLFDHPVGPDVQEYDVWARDILGGRWLWRRVHIHAPLYPYLLAIMYWISSIDFFIVRMAQTLVNLLVGVALYFILRERSTEAETAKYGKWGADLFILLWACYPPLIFHQCELTSEAALMPALCLTLVLLHVAERRPSKSDRPWPWMMFAAAGVGAGLAVIIHPLSLLFAAAEGVFLAARGLLERQGVPKRSGAALRSLVPSAAFVAAVVVVVAPVCVHNSRLAGRAAFVQKNGGFNFFLGNNPDATGGCYLRPGEEWERFHAAARAAADGGSKDALLTRRALAYVVSNPLSWMALTVRKALLVFNRRELPAGADVRPIRCWTPFLRGTRWSFAVLAIWGLFGLFVGVVDPGFRRRNRHFLVLFLSFWAAQTLFVTSGRYRLPMIPPLMVFGAHGLLFFIREIRDLKMVAPMVSAFAAAAVIVLFPEPPIDERGERAEANSILGEAYLRAGDFDRAEERLTAAAAYFARPRERLLNLLGMISERRGRVEEARRRYRAALATRPESPHAYMNLATLASETGEDPKRIEEWFGAALAIRPGDPRILYNLGRHLHRVGRFEEAKGYYRRCLRARPSHVQALNNLAALSLESGHFDEAVELFERAVRLDPDNSRRKKNLATARTAAKRRSEKWRQ